MFKTEHFHNETQMCTVISWNSTGLYYDVILNRIMVGVRPGTLMPVSATATPLEMANETSVAIYATLMEMASKRTAEMNAEAYQYCARYFTEKQLSETKIFWAPSIVELSLMLNEQGHDVLSIKPAEYQTINIRNQEKVNAIRRKDRVN